MKNAKRGGGLAVLILLVAASETSGAYLSLRAGASYFRPSDAVFREVYGAGPSYGAELALGLGRRWEAWTSASIFQRTGRLTFTGEETRIRLTPLFAGARYHFSRSRLQPYVGLGAGYIFYKETSPLGRTTGGSFAYVGQAGLIVKATSWLAVNLRLAYSAGRARGEDFDAELGGLEISLGLGFGR